MVPSVPESTLRRPLLSIGVLIIAALVVLFSAFTLLASGTFTSARITDTLSSGWVAVGVRGVDGDDGVVALLPVGGPNGSAEPVRIVGAAAAFRDNDPNALSQLVGDATRRPMAGAVILDRLAFAALVDVVPGIRLRSSGAGGPGRLDGLEAANYVLADPSGRNLQEGLYALLGSLPRGHDQLVGTVKSLGMSMRATVSAATVVQWLEYWQQRL